MIKGDILRIEAKVLELMNDPAIRAEAEQIAIHGARNGRSKADVVEGAIPGLAIQHSIAAFLEANGHHVVSPPPGVFHYDMIVDGINVDVKARLDGKHFQQSAWEAQELKRTGDFVLYFCVDVMSGMKFLFKGVSWSNELHASSYGCPFVTVFREWAEAYHMIPRWD